MQRNAEQRRSYSLFVAAAALRILLVLAFPGLPDFLSGRVEISTPVTGYKRCRYIHDSFIYNCLYEAVQEGVFLYTRGVSPYDGGVFHQAPLFLPLFSLLQGLGHSNVPSIILYTLLDLFAANALVQISESSEAILSRYFTSPRKDQQWVPATVAAR